MTTWRVDLRISPYDGVKRGPCPSYLSGDPRDRQRGEERASIEIEADNFREAHRLAECVLDGVRLDERVWMASITGIVQVRS